MLQPMEIRLRSDKKKLSIAFSASEIYEYSAELLRVESPSAEVKGHAPQDKKIIAGKKDVFIKSIEPVGHYAVKLIFSDGHSTGLYTWSYLQELGNEKEQLWATYLENMEKLNLKREV